MGHGQVWVERDGFLGEGVGHRQIVATQHHSCGEEIGGSGVGREIVLGGEGFARVVVAAGVEIAQAQHVVAVDVGAGDGKMSFLQQWNGIGWFAGAEEHDPLHLHCFAVGWVLGDGTLEGCGR